MARPASVAVLLALAAASRAAAAWPFSGVPKTGLPGNATKLPAYLAGNGTARFKEGLAQAKEALNATGLFNASNVALVRVGDAGPSWRGGGRGGRGGWRPRPRLFPRATARVGC